VLTSPTGKEEFDVIERIENVDLVYRRRRRASRLSPRFPLGQIGWRPTPEPRRSRLDLGYIFANATGAQAGIRSYWSNNGFSAGVVNDVPNESRLEPNLWGTASVECTQQKTLRSPLATPAWSEQYVRFAGRRTGGRCAVRALDQRHSRRHSNTPDAPGRSAGAAGI